MAPRGRSPVLVDCFLGDMSAGPPKHDRRHRQRKHRGRCRLLEVMRLPPVINTLAAVAPVKDLLQLLQTCRETAQMKGSVIASEWNIDRFLAHFLPSPTTFRQLQAASGAIITGPAVRSFLDRALTSGPNGNLAVIVTLGQDGDLRAYPDGTHMQRSRVRTGMFRAVGRNVSAPTAPKLLIQYYGSSAITRSARYTSSDGAVIDLIVTETAVLRCLLINCLTSTQANFMTASRAISLFPYPTFISGASFLCGEMTPSAVTQERLQVDFESGYVVQHNPWKGEIPKSVNPFKRYRRVGDRFTWSTNLTGWEAHSKTCLDLQIDVSTFTVRFGSASPIFPANRMSPPCYLITVDELKSPVLQHVYTVAPRKPPLQERVDQLTAIELHRITPKDKLMQLGRIADSLNTANPDVPWSLFQKVDDQIPIWLALYEESTQKAAARRCRIYGNRAPSFSDHSRISHSPSMDSLSGESIASSGY